MTDPDKIFLALKSETRRQILAMLAREPMYLTQLSSSLGYGQQAIFRHLQLLESAGLLESNFKDAGQGAPRKYYQIAGEVRVEVKISPEIFDIGLFDVKKLEVPTPKDFPELKSIVKKCKELSSQPNSREKLAAYSKQLQLLAKELDQINIAKSIAEATYSRIRHQIRIISFELLPRRIDQRIIQTLASRGGKLAISDLALILNLSEDTIRERLQILQQAKLVNLIDDICTLQ